MTDRTDDTGKGPQGPGGAPKRPYATIDVRATEIGKGTAGASREAGRDSGRDPGAPRRPGAGFAALPPPVRDGWRRAWTLVWGGLAAAWAWWHGVARGDSFAAHAAAGVAGAVLTLAVASLLGLLSAGGRSSPEAQQAAQQLAAVEKTLLQRTAALESVAAKLASAEARLARLEGQLQAAQSRQAADAKAIEARIPPADIAGRVARLESGLAALSAQAEKPGAARADVEKLNGEAKAASARAERDLADLKTEAARLKSNLEALKTSLDERTRDAAKAGDLAPVLAKVAAVERDLQTMLRSEGERSASTRQVLLSLELANLKRAVDRGDGFAPELDAVRKAAGGSVDLAPLEGPSRTGVATLGMLTEEFRRVADKALDAETERPDASVLDRLAAGARSIVRVRKAHYDPGDDSVEAVLSRMEGALKDGRIGEALEQGKRLPPKAALAAGDWLRKLEARHAADRAIAGVEAALKASLASQPVPARPETTR